MNIGQAARLSGLRRKTIRYYEDVGLVHPDRSANGFRDFRTEDCRKLMFLARARSLGFALDDCRSLLALYEDRSRPSRDVRRIAEEALARLVRLQRNCETLRSVLADLAACSEADSRPDYPVLPDIEQERQTVEEKEV